MTEPSDMQQDPAADGEPTHPGAPAPTGQPAPATQEAGPAADVSSAGAADVSSAGAEDAGARGAASFTPAPTPQTDWARVTWSREAAQAQSTPEHWFEPVPAEPGSAGMPAPTGALAVPPVPAPATPGPAAPSPWSVPGTPATPGIWTPGGSSPIQPVATGPVRREPRVAGPGAVLGAALLAAVLASSGTYAALEASGSLNHGTQAPAGANGGPQGTATSAQQPISIVESSAIIDAAAKTGPAVVRITATGTAVDLSGGAIPATGIGSGVIYEASGWILTNRHVVTGTNGQLVSALTVELKDGRTFQGTIYGVDTLTDLAIVRIQGSGLPVAPIGTSANLKVGQLAVAIGSPLGTFSNSVTSGIVSATGRSITVENERLTNLIQTDAAINPGNSGGPLLDAGGNVIGINTAIASDSNGIGFAIPVDIARPIMQQALAGQALSRPYLGVRYVGIDKQLQADRTLSVDKGALVGGGTGGGQSIVTGGPAEKAGIKDGDIITSIGGTDIDTEHPLDLVLSSHAPGQTIQVKLLRDGKGLTVSVTLGTRPAGL